MDQLGAAAQGGLGEAIVAGLRFSWSGVDLFFVLSGFLIARVLVRNRQAHNYFRVFYIRRACRILPAYALLLAGYYAAILTGVAAGPRFAWLFAGPMPDFSYLTFTQNLQMGAHATWGAAWLTPTWSLAVEEQFYLVVPALALLSRSRLAAVAIGAVAAAPLLRLLYPGFHTYVATPFRADSLAAGVLLALALENATLRQVLVRRRRWLRGALIAMGSGTVVLTLFPWRGALEFTWLAALYATFVALALVDPASRMARTLRWAPLRWVGVRSYSLYLFHLPVLGLVQGARGLAAPEISGASDLAATLLAFGISLAVAALGYRFVEQPFIELGQRARYAAGPSARSGRDVVIAT